MKRGLDITNTPSIPSGAQPAVSLAVLDDLIGKLTPIEAGGLQKGAAAAFRRELLTGKDLNLDIAERARQFGFAAKTPAAVKAMADVERLWKSHLERARGLTPGEGPTLEPAAGGPIARVIRILAPTMLWTGSKALKDLAGESSALALSRRQVEDAAYINMLRKKPGSIKALVDQLDWLNATRKSTVQQTTARGARSVGVPLAKKRGLLSKENE